ncbi:unnamed protein product [Brachionus calyciflorus]|uniref:Integrase catalytic domain-containing protein n=1 Tax=Brachionus calyciflorus TaxID=104777 RepID=A0A813MCI4_9BILA|nr:unnamed protein product [Brachionus calyciflorus]
MTTFSTHIGLFRDKRLNFGYCSAAEMFQYLVSEVLKELEGVLNVSDDIIVYGRTEEEYMERLHKVLERLEKSGLTANPEKCEFGKRSIEFFGVVFSEKGVAPSEERIKALKSLGPPKDKKELESFLVFATFSAIFILDFSTITEPLRHLVRNSEGNKIKWETHHNDALEKLKESLSTDAIAYFDPNWESELVVDASPVGLACILIQVDPKNAKNKREVAYASRTLSELERKYAHVEKEALACIYGCERFYVYVFGKKFKLVTDNKAVQFIYNGTKGRSQARIERWGLRLSCFDFEVIHRPGLSNIADYMSRHPDPEEKSADEWLSEEFVNFVVTNSMPKSITREQVVNETEKDVLLQLVKNSLSKSFIKSEDRTKLGVFYKLLGEIMVTNDGILLRDRRIILPSALQRLTVKIAHEAHLGIVKTKGILRSKVWFPNLDKQVEQEVKNCRVCQCCTSEKLTITPVVMSKMPENVWQEVSIDFFGPLPNGEYGLVVEDDCPRFVSIKIAKSTSAEPTISRLEDVFTYFGIPGVIRTDNGPPFNSKAFRDYCVNLGIRHRKITPPRANGKCERFMQNLGKFVSGLNLYGKNWKCGLNILVRSYNSAPHCTTKVAPVMLMFNRSNFTKLPSIDFKETQWGENLKKARVDLQPGDWVLIKQKKENKLTAKYEVVATKGTMVTVRDKAREVTRNTTFFKKIILNATEAAELTSAPERELNNLDAHDNERYGSLIQQEVETDKEINESGDEIQESDENENTAQEFHSLSSSESNSPTSTSPINQLEKRTLELATKKLLRSCKKAIDYKKTKFQIKTLFCLSIFCDYFYCSLKSI